MRILLFQVVVGVIGYGILVEEDYVVFQEQVYGVKKVKDVCVQDLERVALEHFLLKGFVMLVWMKR